MRSVELFAGAGGLALGTTQAGFTHEAVVERDRHACATLRLNGTTTDAGHSWPVFEADVSSFDYGIIRPGLDLLAGGPPCQPFSTGGKREGVRDSRNMFPEFMRAIVALQPRSILIENVRGLTFKSFSQYFRYLLLQLAHPEVLQKNNESWKQHLRRLSEHSTSNGVRGLSYQVAPHVVNAADYGIPQWRERIFIVAFRTDQETSWDFPSPTHSFDSLIWDQWVTGSYWDHHQIARRPRGMFADSKYLYRVQRIFKVHQRPTAAPWRTVRDALRDLPSPTTPAAIAIPNHRHNPGARIYPGHTGSHLDAPAKTLKAGSHGVPGGENMLAHANGKVRYFTVRECARLQTFPDSYVFPNDWCVAMRQVGNAVPVDLSRIVAQSIREALRPATQSQSVETSKR